MLHLAQSSAVFKKRPPLLNSKPCNRRTTYVQHLAPLSPPLPPSPLLFLPYTPHPPQHSKLKASSSNATAGNGIAVAALLAECCRVALQGELKQQRGATAFQKKFAAELAELLADARGALAESRLLVLHQHQQALGARKGGGGGGANNAEGDEAVHLDPSPQVGRTGWGAGRFRSRHSVLSLEDLIPPVDSEWTKSITCLMQARNCLSCLGERHCRTPFRGTNHPTSALSSPVVR